LLDEMSLRRTSDRLWGDQCFITSQVLGWLVVVASFGSAIAAASHAPALVVAIAAAIPGTVILIDQRFDFARQAQWHWMQENEIRELEHALSFQGAKVADISRKYTALLKEMERKFTISPQNLRSEQKGNGALPPPDKSTPPDK
jgi:hypothetical protein